MNDNERTDELQGPQAPVVLSREKVEMDGWPVPPSIEEVEFEMEGWPDPYARS